MVSVGILWRSGSAAPATPRNDAKHIGAARSIAVRRAIGCVRDEGMTANAHDQHALSHMDLCRCVCLQPQQRHVAPDRAFTAPRSGVLAGTFELWTPQGSCDSDGRDHQTTFCVVFHTEIRMDVQ